MHTSTYFFKPSRCILRSLTVLCLWSLLSLHCLEVTFYGNQTKELYGIFLQGSEWQMDAYLSSRNNLEALREINARGVSFLKTSSPVSPSVADSSHGAAVKRPAESSVESSPIQRASTFRNQGCTRVGVAKPLMSQIGFNIA